MIEIELRETQSEEYSFGYLQLHHEFPNVGLMLTSDDGDRTRTERLDLTREEQDFLLQQPIPGHITLANPSGSGVRLSNIQIQMDIDEEVRSMDYDVALVDPDGGLLHLVPDYLDPGEERACEYAWIITNKFGEIGQGFSVVLSIRPSYTVTMLAVSKGTQLDRTQDIGVATVEVSA